MIDRELVVSIAFALVVFTGVVHGVLAVGTVALDGVNDLLPAAFVLAAVLSVLLVVGYYSGSFTSKPIYAVGAVLMGSYLVAYADWHVFGTIESTLGLDDVGLGHDHGHDHHGHGHDEHDTHGHGHHDHGHDDGSSHGDAHDDHSAHDYGIYDYGIDGHDHGSHEDHSAHDGPARQVLFEHLRNDPTALVTKLAEAAALTLFAWLYASESDE